MPRLGGAADGERQGGRWIDGPDAKVEAHVGAFARRVVHTHREFHRLAGGKVPVQRETHLGRGLAAAAIEVVSKGPGAPGVGVRGGGDVEAHHLLPVDIDDRPVVDEPLEAEMGDCLGRGEGGPVVGGEAITGWWQLVRNGVAIVIQSPPNVGHEVAGTDAAVAEEPGGGPGKGGAIIGGTRVPGGVEVAVHRIRIDGLVVQIYRQEILPVAAGRKKLGNRVETRRDGVDGQRHRTEFGPVSIDRDVVGGFGHHIEREPRSVMEGVVVAGGGHVEIGILRQRSQGVDRGPSVDCQQGIEIGPGETDRDPPGRRWCPPPPDRPAACLAGMTRFTGLLAGTQPEDGVFRRTRGGERRIPAQHDGIRKFVVRRDGEGRAGDRVDPEIESHVRTAAAGVVNAHRDFYRQASQ